MQGIEVYKFSYLSLNSKVIDDWSKDKEVAKSVLNRSRKMLLNEIDKIDKQLEVLG